MLSPSTALQSGHPVIRVRGGVEGIISFDNYWIPAFAGMTTERATGTAPKMARHASITGSSRGVCPAGDCLIDELFVQRWQSWNSAVGEFVLWQRVVDRGKPWCGAVILLWAIGFPVYQYTINGPKAAVRQAELEREMSRLTTLAGASLVRSTAFHKPESALVSNDYRSNLRYPKIRAYYDRELSRFGWTFVHEEKLFDWGSDLGGMSARYCKGAYEAALQFAGADARYGWDYAFSLQWKMANMFERGTGCQDERKKY
jgi:hypothetical protein